VQVFKKAEEKKERRGGRSIKLTGGVQETGEGRYWKSIDYPGSQKGKESWQAQLWAARGSSRLREKKHTVPKKERTTL